MSEHEISTKGALDLAGNGQRRVTARLAALTGKVLEAVLAHAVDQRKVEADLAAVVSRIVHAALTGYQADRSCRTCDFESLNQAPGSTGSWCSRWGDAIPPDAVEGGCEKYQSTGVPF